MLGITDEIVAGAVDEAIHYRLAQREHAQRQARESGAAGSIPDGQQYETPDDVES